MEYKKFSTFQVDLNHFFGFKNLFKKICVVVNNNKLDLARRNKQRHGVQSKSVADAHADADAEFVL